MRKMSETVVFFGSGPVAAESLALLVNDFEIEAVVTKPQPPHHKEAAPVILLAEKIGLNVVTASTKTELDALFATKPFKSRLAILIDFGIIVSQNVIDAFPLGIINSHFSVLPEWRGADPITFAVLSGQASTGVSLMLLVVGMDEGPLLAYGEYELPPDITTPLLTQHLINFSHALLRDVMPKYIAGEMTPAPQTVTGRAVSYSRKLTKEDGLLDWHKPAAILEREVRAFIGWPRSRTTLGRIDVVITAAHIGDGSGTPGQVRIENKQLGVFTSDGILIIDRLIPSGKREMPASAFLSGYQLS